MRVDSVRARLTLFWVGALAIAMVVVGGLIYVLLARALYTRIDDNLRAVVEVAATSLGNDLAEGQDYQDAARSTAAELSSRQQMLAIFDVRGRLLAEGGRDEDLAIDTSEWNLTSSPSLRLLTVAETNDDNDRHRLAVARVTVGSGGDRYVVVVGSSLEPTDEELESLRLVLAYVIPIALAIAGAGGWFLARQSLSPVAVMAQRAREIGVGDLSGRLPVVNPRDELGALAETFNELLTRLEASMLQQRQFMADASHELRTPIAIARTSAAVTLQQPTRHEHEYRESLALIEQQTARLSRIVEDLFTLARADTGTYPVRRTPMYLDEVIDEVVRAARVLAATREVTIDLVAEPSASFTGDEELIRRLVGNLVDNAIRHAPRQSTVRLELTREHGGYGLTVSDSGDGIPPEVQAHIFERFFRGDAARSSAGGAGLGLALVRWIARIHDGDVSLVDSSPSGTVFKAVLPHRN